MRKENIPIHSEDRVARSKTVSDKNNPGTKSIGSIKGFFLKMVIIWFYSGDNLSILNFAINSL